MADFTPTRSRVALLTALLLLCHQPLPALAAGKTAPAHATAPDDDEGFTHPLDSLRYLPQDEGNFERASLEALEVSDPLESVNRRIYHFNQRLDEKVLLPVVRSYRFFVPAPVRTGVSNFFSNLGDVGNFANSLLQLKGKRSLETGGRLLLNTTVGLAGLWDPATRVGLVKQSEDFGQTLGHYGVGQGAYVMLPLLGPSNVRDAGGRAVDFVGDQEINFLDVPETSRTHVEITALRAVDTRATTDFRYGQLNTPFEYEKLRYVYSRARALQVRD